jgi:indole-3-glycerol phosphate synthase
LRVIAEIKRKSPSAGVLRPWAPGDAVALARAYVDGGAAAVSVLCDGPGFGGSPLDLRRVARTVTAPLLFKEFVLDEVQLELARDVGAHMALLLVRALPPERLHRLVEAALALGLAPLVEAADDTELDAALATRAVLIGVNARDLQTFRVDSTQAARAIARIPADRIAVHMSGIRTPRDFSEVAHGRADAVLIGEGLMRAVDPAAQLREFLRAPR